MLPSPRVHLPQGPAEEAARHGKVDPEIWRKLNANFEEFREHGIEPSMPLAIITGEREVVRSTWGFHRRFKRKDGKAGSDGTGLTAPKAVVNAQSEKMETYMWRDAYHHRRCLIPVTEFYEWTGPPKAKIAHRIFIADDYCFFVAGLWEESPDFGLCHTMLTTEPTKEVAATGHDRCLVVLLDQIDPWLNGDVLPDFHRPDGIFQVASNVPNPRAPNRPAQGDVF
ncbi:MAG: hypothetical protein EOP83_00430 [Verrucomicrobiaceae bacterium]|nr:MAG: hypothetical protein EOP83_00430 [Verrucomicrobiaceae bacterium]